MKEEKLRNWMQNYQCILDQIDELQKAGESPVIIGIDGKCAAGKTTLGEALQSHYDCNLFHMDDFFLQNVQRTPERLAEPGGNVDYERFEEEVLTPIRNGQAVFYRPFHCSVRQIAEGTWIPYKRINIVEGSYSLHPYFHEPYQLKIFLDLDEKLQLDTIRQRNGAEQLKRFVKEWIPKENTYFQTYQIQEGCIKLSR